MSITVKELNDTIKSNRRLLEDLKLERERVRIGFLGGETPRLMALLTDTIHLIEKLTGDLIEGRRELKRRLKAERKIEKEDSGNPVLPMKPLSKRQKKKAKRFRSPIKPSRRRNLI